MPANRNIGSRQAEACASWALGCKERVEYPGQCIRSHASSLVREPHECLVGADAGFNKKAPTRPLHCIQSVEYYVNENLAQFRDVPLERLHRAWLEVHCVIDATSTGVILP